MEHYPELPDPTNEEIALANVDDFLIWDPTASAFHCYSITDWRSTLDNSQRCKFSVGFNMDRLPH